MAEGKITSVVADRGFFFIDVDYFCHVKDYDREPEVGQTVEYERAKRDDGKKFAKRARFKSSNGDVNVSPEEENVVDEFIKSLEKGYFSDMENLKKEFIVDYPLKLAQFFGQQGQINNPTQIRNFYETVINIYRKSKYNKNFESAKSELFGIIPQLEKARNRNLISREFQLYLTSSIYEAVKSVENFEKGLVKNFEYLICYYIKK